MTRHQAQPAQEIASPCPASPPATPRCAPSGAPATTCTIAATTSSTSPRRASSRRSPTCWCTAACRPRAELAGYKAKLQPLRGLPASVKRDAGGAAGGGASDGRDAHRRLGARLRAAREGRPEPARRARHRRPADGLARLHAALLVPLRPQRPAHRGGDRRRQHRRAFPASAARQAAERVCVPRDAHLADPLRRARVQRLDLHLPGDRRHRRGHVFGDHRRASARCAGRSMAAPTRSRSKSRSATTTPTRRRPTSAGGSRPRRSSSASAMPSTRSPIRATR